MYISSYPRNTGLLFCHFPFSFLNWLYDGKKNSLYIGFSWIHIRCIIRHPPARPAFLSLHLTWWVQTRCRLKGDTIGKLLSLFYLMDCVGLGSGLCLTPIWPIQCSSVKYSQEIYLKNSPFIEHLAGRDVNAELIYSQAIYNIAISNVDNIW